MCYYEHNMNTDAGFDNPRDRSEKQPRSELSQGTFNRLLEHAIKLSQAGEPTYTWREQTFDEAIVSGRYDNEEVVVGNHNRIEVSNFPDNLGGHINVSTFNESFAHTDLHPDGSHSLGSLSYKIYSRPYSPKASEAMITLTFTTSHKIFWQVEYATGDDPQKNADIEDAFEERGLPVKMKTHAEKANDEKSGIRWPSGKLDEQQGRALRLSLEEIGEE